MASGARDGHLPLAARTVLVVSLLVGAYVAGLHDLGYTRLVDETEPIFAESSRQMLVTGNFVSPAFNGAPRYDKPPLIYWLQAACYRVFGVNELAARLPSALAMLAVGAGVFLAVFFVGPADDQRGRWGGAWVAAAAWLLAPEAWVWGRTGVSDMVLTACVSGALLAFAAGLARSSPGWLVAAAAMCGLGALAKGPVAPVLVASTAALTFAWVRPARPVMRVALLVQVVITFAVVALPWYVLMTWSDGRAFLDAFLGYHNLQRFASVVNRHAGPWWYYAPVFAAGFLPWSVLLPRAVAWQRPWNRARWRKEQPAASLGFVACAWLCVVVGFFTLAQTKLPSYVLPAMPAAAILVGLASADVLGRRPRCGAAARDDGSAERPRGRMAEGAAVAIVCGALAVCFWLAPGWMAASPDPDTRAMAALFRETGLVARGAWLWACAAIACAVLTAVRRAPRVPIVLAAVLTAFLAAVLLPAARVADHVRQRPLYTLALEAAAIAPPPDPLVMIGFWKPSLVFYSRRQVVFLQALDELESYRVANASRPTVLIADNRLWQGTLPAHAVVRREGRYVLARIP